MFSVYIRRFAAAVAAAAVAASRVFLRVIETSRRCAAVMHRSANVEERKNSISLPRRRQAALPLETM